MPLRFRRLAACAALLCAGCGDENPGPAAAPVGDPSAPLAQRINASTLALLPKKPGRNFVFDGYETPDRPGAAWSRFWTEPVDFTGVAWDRPQTLTMISPRHAVMAAHYPRPKDQQLVMFHDARGRTVERLIVARQALDYDIAVVLLHEDMPAGVRSYAVPAPSEDYAYSLPGALALMTTRKRTVLVHEVEAVIGAFVRFRQPRQLDAGFSGKLVTGDSGNPSFLWLRGQPVLLGTHTHGGSGAGPFFGDPDNQAAINAAMQSLSEAHGAPVYRLRTVRL